jgi:FAD-dependent urate hydroxylase
MPSPEQWTEKPLAENASQEAFVARFGHLFEHSPWIVERAWKLHPPTTLAALHTAFQTVIGAASRDEQLKLLRAHPKLADKAAITKGLTPDSTSEQAAAGLGQLTPEEFSLFQDLNARYEARFGFPFIICARLHEKADIIAALQARSEGEAEAEFAEALAQVDLISRLRLEDALRETNLAALSARVRHDLESIEYNGADWVRPRRTPEGEAVLDVAIVGGGQSGLAAAFALKRERIRNLVIFDENPVGLEGPWITYARMRTLRTPKALSTLDLGVPSLTFRAWWEAQHGQDGWARLDKIPRETWMNYLGWFRDVLDLPVCNETKVVCIEPVGDGLHRLTLEGPGAPATGQVLARAAVFATGIHGGGAWHIPEEVRAAVRKARYAHTSEAIDYAALAGKRIAILGGGASAFDNAQFALARGVTAVHVFLRREALPRINPIRHMEVSGLIRHYAGLSDPQKYRVIRHFLLHAQPPTNDTFERAAAYRGFQLRLGEPWLALTEGSDGVTIRTPKGESVYDFLIFSTGLVTDLALRPELALVREKIALWSDRYKAPADEALPLLDQHPYLGPGFEFTAKDTKGAAQLRGLYAFNYSALATLGLSAAALSGLRFAAPKLAAAISSQLFREDEAELLDAFLTYDEPEFMAQWPAD